MVFGSKKKESKKKKAETGKGGKTKSSGAKNKSSAEEQPTAPEEIGISTVEVSQPEEVSPSVGGTASQIQAGDKQRAAEMVPGPPAEEIFVDGVSSLFFRSGVVKLDCYRVVGHNPNENREVRMATHKLVLPVTAIQELLRLLQNASNIQRSQEENVRSDEVG